MIVSAVLAMMVLDVVGDDDDRVSASSDAEDAPPTPSASDVQPMTLEELMDGTVPQPEHIALPDPLAALDLLVSGADPLPDDRLDESSQELPSQDLPEGPSDMGMGMRDGGALVYADTLAVPAVEVAMPGPSVALNAPGAATADADVQTGLPDPVHRAVSGIVESRPDIEEDAVGEGPGLEDAGNQNAGPEDAPDRLADILAPMDEFIAPAEGAFEGSEDALDEVLSGSAGNTLAGGAGLDKFEITVGAEDAAPVVIKDLFSGQPDMGGAHSAAQTEAVWFRHVDGEMMSRGDLLRGGLTVEDVGDGESAAVVLRGNTVAVIEGVSADRLIRNSLWIGNFRL